MDNQRVNKLIIGIFRILLLGAIIGNILSHNWLNFFTSILALVISYLPEFLSERHYIHISSGMQFIIIFFTFASLYLGELNQYYLKFWWWDIMLHTLSGIILGFIGFLLIYILNKNKNINVVLSPVFVAIFSFAFAVAVGVFWEIFEFAADSWLGLNMQKSGLVDTMWDLIVDCLGALCASITGFVYLTQDKPFYFKKAIKKFLSQNNQFFNK